MTLFFVNFCFVFDNKNNKFLLSDNRDILIHTNSHNKNILIDIQVVFTVIINVKIKFIEKILTKINVISI